MPDMDAKKIRRCTLCTAVLKSADSWICRDCDKRLGSEHE